MGYNDNMDVYDELLNEIENYLKILQQGSDQPSFSDEIETQPDLSPGDFLEVPIVEA